MFKTMNKRIKNEKGLTLIELLAVIVILAIVAAIAVPAIGNIIENSKIKALKSDAANIISAAAM
ncbi:MAG TPA: prepilin-type N-terminal cleavage/methylation domain-containing protein, partial [Ureibacillus sp.]|nr:prepilin-type N-terminal cleavage/methylation domain-containing protein [Ureibacillus sp.]